MALAGCVAALAQTPTYKNVGKTPSAEEIRASDIFITPEGKELPPRSGTAKQGAQIFSQQCARCHGPTGTEVWGGPRLVKGKGTNATIGDLYPFATTIWDYINRAMPISTQTGGPPEGRNPDEVYALTALLLYWNGIIRENDVLDAKSLPKIQMPNRNGFVPPWPPKYEHLKAREFGSYTVVSP